jgi:HEPN domain-containing protein
MGYYSDAEEWHGTAIDMESCGRYRGAVYMSCLAVECFLKSRVEIIEPNNPRLKEHDTIYLYRLLKEKYPTGENLLPDIRLCRKYHSDARYANTPKPELYDKVFANRLIAIARKVKDYIDNDCAATLEELAVKFNTKPK